MNKTTLNMLGIGPTCRAKPLPHSMWRRNWTKGISVYPQSLKKIKDNLKTVFIEQASNKDLWLHLRAEGELHASKFQETLATPTKYQDLTATCDYQSIMMYNLFANAALAAKKVDSSLAVDFTPTARESVTQLDIQGSQDSLPSLDGNPDLAIRFFTCSNRPSLADALNS